jgi:DNA-binding transcriptional regulator YiaG
MEANMKCIECGHETEARKEDRMLDLGLPYHVVARAAPVHVCPSCGARYPGLQAPLATLNALALWIARRPARLHGSEIRFVRNALGWSQDQLGHRLGVAVATISRWENSKKPMGYQSELALRFLVLAGGEVAERIDSDAELPSRVDVLDTQVVEAA